MTTNETPTPAEMADRHVKAAQAALSGLRNSVRPAAEEARILREVEFAMDAAQVYSRIAVAKAIGRSFPALEAEYTDGCHRALPGDLAEYGINVPEQLDRRARG